MADGSNRYCIIVGCYNGLIVGFELNKQKNVTLKPFFTDTATTRSVKHLAMDRRHLIVSSTDDTMRVFDLMKNIELGSILQNDSVTSVTILNDYIITSEQSGLIKFHSKSSSLLIKEFKVHCGPCNSISLLRDSPLLLTTGADRFVKLWDLTNLKLLSKLKIDKAADKVLWSPGGNKYILIQQKSILIIDIENDNKPKNVEFSNTVISIEFIKNDVIVVGGEFSSIHVVSLENCSVLNSFEAHEKRVKSLVYDQNNNYLYSLSTDGSLKTWCIENNSEKNNYNFVCLNEVFIPTRPISMVGNYVTEKSFKN